MKLLFMVVLVMCISLTASQKKKGKDMLSGKKICKKDVLFLLSVVRLCKLYRQSLTIRTKQWSSLYKYLQYALKVSAPKKKPKKGKGQKKQTRKYLDEDIILDDGDVIGLINDADSSSFEDFDGFDNEDEEKSEADPPPRPSDTEAEIRGLRRYLKLSRSTRRERAAKPKRKPPPPSTQT
ncbi:uncharacterized protein LOC124117501 [Haliotis rufescens]|uniref:uncharacterized protein LOC124117501 n=1 Tax=Haliotis rufescens TaxID=6454 RepID=UPI00201F3DD6|nr:uncharacterized protein LOC124117501 [Haliotis rufescens]